MQVAKIFDLRKQMHSPKDLDAVELRTATFPVLLNRATKFLDIGDAAPHLHKLHKIRNSLIHHRGAVDILEVNLLLVRHIFPLVERLSTTGKYRKPFISKNAWSKIRGLEKRSVSDLSSQLAKKITHYSEVFSRLSDKKVGLLAASQPETLVAGEELVESRFMCRACKNETLAAFRDYDVETEDGEPVAAYVAPNMRCRVCGLKLEESEILYIIANFTEYVGDDETEKKAWKQWIDECLPDF
jgi:hypothetical protein